MKLLIADDSLMIRERIKNLVRNFTEVSIVGEAGNGKTAMEMIRKFDPDLLLLDLRMPEMGGMDVLKGMKEANMRTKVCILTNYPYPQYRDKCLALGADYFLCKSDDFEKLNIVISNTIKESEKRNANKIIN
ncbi:MAG: response regulator transcription factor [Bacteroidales bacterium]|nr:response regulator transcription factor [Bacteroidales bacterium]